MVCTQCAVVQRDVHLPRGTAQLQTARRQSNYKRLHHFHERVSQLLLQESPIPDDQFQRIAACILASQHEVGYTKAPLPAVRSEPLLSLSSVS